MGKFGRAFAGIALTGLVAGYLTVHAGEPGQAKKEGPGENTKDEPLARTFSLEKAGGFLDAAALDWQQKKNCFACHTNFAYLYARPAVSAQAPAHALVRKSLENLVTRRWPAKGPRWDAEVVAAAAALAYNDAATTGKLQAVTLTALERMWKVQRRDGGFKWIKCNWPPIENDDHYGVTLAALAVGAAPENYGRTAPARAGLDGIRRYLKANPPQNLHHQAMVLWAASYLDGFMTEAEKKACIQALLARQLPDGGWSAATLGNWKRADKLEQDLKTSDGYGTGFSLFILRRGGVGAHEGAMKRGVAWLQANQRASGRWFTRSLNRDNKHYLSHAGTAFAVMALEACAEK